MPPDVGMFPKKGSRPQRVFNMRWFPTISWSSARFMGGVPRNLFTIVLFLQKLSVQTTSPTNIKKICWFQWFHVHLSTGFRKVSYFYPDRFEAINPIWSYFLPNILGMEWFKTTRSRSICQIPTFGVHFPALQVTNPNLKGLLMSGWPSGWCQSILKRKCEDVYLIVISDISTCPCVYNYYYYEHYMIYL